MKLKSLQIKNYRSIEDISFDIPEIEDQSFTYGLIGINEVGKSSILKALALKDGLKDKNNTEQPIQKDFKDVTRSIEVVYDYEFNEVEVGEIKELLEGDSEEKEEILVKNLIFKIEFEYANPATPITSINVANTTYKLGDPQLQTIKEYVLKKIHRSVFWTAEDRYLITQPIPLSQFSTDPDSVSIPLKNCFRLANLEDKISTLPTVTDAASLQDITRRLGNSVTDHIKSIWKNHEVSIAFHINAGQDLTFLVYDNNSESAAKTVDQRSDGFKQFISFLLTVSAENKNEELSDSILLIDEPETHLHPQAQEFLLQELVSTTKNNRNNIVFFATHSNYMIDKIYLNRNYRIYKPDDTSKQEQQRVGSSTYASVTYEVFGIPNADYHNELYSKLHEDFQNIDTTDEKRSHILNFDTEFLHKEKGLVKDKPWKGNANEATLPTYIRNSIHHPDNGNTYTNDDLRQSIDLLRSYI